MRPFILIELLIAFALVSASALPFIRYPLQHLSREIDALFQMELSREAEKAFADVQIALLQNKIPPSFLEKPKFQIYQKETQEISLTPRLARRFERVIKLKPESQKKTNEGEEFTLLKVVVSFFPPSKSKAVLQADMVLFCKRV